MNKELENIKCFLLDMDGTVHISYKPYPGAADAIARMRKQGRVIYITNKVTTPISFYVKALQKMGIPCTRDDFYTATSATIDYLRAEYAGKRIWVFGTRSFHRELKDAGINIINKPGKTDLNKEDADLVVLGYNTEMKYRELGRLCVMIRKGIPFIATQPDFNCPDINGYLPDVGSFMALVKASTGAAPIAICGKPHTTMGEGVARLVGCNPSEVAVFGDRLATDIAFANANGFVSVLVLTGEATRVDHENGPHKAKIILDSIADF